PQCDPLPLHAALPICRLISSACGVRNTVVTMKKMSNRNATSTIGVMSIAMPMRRFFLSIAQLLTLVGGRRREQLDRLVRRLVHRSDAHTSELQSLSHL